MDDEDLSLPRGIRLEFWVNDDMTMSIKKSSLKLTDEELKLFHFADELVQLRGVGYERTRDPLSQIDSDAGKVYRIFTYGVY